MWRIPKPAYTAADTFDTCIAGIRTADLRNRLLGVRDHVVAAADAFDVAAAASDLHLVAKTNGVSGSVTTAEMTALYDRHLARDRSRGRPIYDELMLAAVDDICPFCGHRVVSTLDHCLPKADHPALAVAPVNLVPCCKDCNFDKGTLAVTGKEDQLLNAYYDDVTGFDWLGAEIVEGAPAGIIYSVLSPQGMDPTLHSRVSNHFDQLGLAKLYASQGGRYLRNIRRSLRSFYLSGGAAAVESDLLLRLESCRGAERNSWQAALYSASASSEWYCNGGFDA